MKHNIYGRKMFVIDLIIVSIWAFFFSRYSRPGLMALILVRIALSFEMHRKSPWTLISAVGFLIAFTCVNNFSRPFEKMFYIFFCAIGESELMVDIFSEPFEWKMEAWIGFISAVWFIWLAVLPIVVGIRLHNCREIQWKRKWIWIYLIPFAGLCIWVMFEEGSVGSILLGLVISLLPVIYWSIYERKGRSLIQTIINQKEILWYLAYTVFLLSAVTIGLKDISSLKLVGVLTLPPLFYIILTLSLRSGVVLTRVCATLSVAGLCYWLTLDYGETGTVILLIFAITLIVYSAVTMMVKIHKWMPSLLLAAIIPIIVIPCILGLNPYVVTDADHTRMYLTNLSVRNGVYVVEKPLELTETLYSCARKYGLRDRYGSILPMEYEGLKPVDGSGRYLATTSPSACLPSGHRYGIYDLRKREFILNSHNVDVSKIEKINDNSFKLINPEGRYFATLYLPGVCQDAYFPDAHIEPHFADGETSVAEFLGRVMDPELYAYNYYWKTMYRENPKAFGVLIQIWQLSGGESSPVNDLNYARAIREIIDGDPYYKGDIDKVLNDVSRLIIRITDSGSQSDINAWSDFMRLISSIRTSLAYDTVLNSITDNECINKEYVAWHNLIEAMSYYLDRLYSTETYRSVPEEKNSIITSWLDYRTETLGKELEILCYNLIYSVDRAKTDSLRNESQYNALFSKFSSPSDPYRYHPVWNEIKPAFEKWIYTREKLADNLEPHSALSYREYSREVADGVFSFIEGLKGPGIRHTEE